MSDAIWWIGVIHIAAYATVGAFVLITMAVVKIHLWFEVMGRIVQWHYARARWKRRHSTGLTDAEWQKGEPRP